MYFWVTNYLFWHTKQQWFYTMYIITQSRWNILNVIFMIKHQNHYDFDLFTCRNIYKYFKMLFGSWVLIKSPLDKPEVKRCLYIITKSLPLKEIVKQVIGKQLASLLFRIKIVQCLIFFIKYRTFHKIVFSYYV